MSRSKDAAGKRRRAETRGRKGEALAAWYLRLKGWRILARPDDTRRIDVILLAPGRWPRHIVNAWMP